MEEKSFSAVMGASYGTKDHRKLLNLDAENQHPIKSVKGLRRELDDLDNAVKENQRYIALERARIDTFTALPEGATTNDAELADIRVGADGVTYDSAGLAIRTQIWRHSEQLTEVMADRETLTGKNIFNIDTLSQTGEWVVHNTGAIETYPTNAYIQNYCHSDYIPVVGGKSYVYSGGNDNVVGGTYLYSYAFFDSSKDFVSGAFPAGYSESVITVPENAAFIIINFQRLSCAQANVQLERGEAATEYEPFKSTPNYYHSRLLVRADQIERSTGNMLKLPEKYDLVVGDTFELFYKGVFNALDTDYYDFELTFSDNVNRGKAWKRKYEYTPTEADVGEKVLNIVVRGNDGVEIERKTVALNIVAAPKNPTSQRNVLCVGDSLTEGGVWCHELHRRLTASSGSPVGYGLSNINFIGTCEKDGTKYEGYGGWTFGSYNTAQNSDKFMNIYGAFSKTANDQHAVYADSNGVQWKLETTGASHIKIIRVSASGTLPSSGSLTWVSGGENTDAITYTSSEMASGNPFWNESKQANDFVAYSEKFGVRIIDHVYILLGWNNTSTAEESYKANARAFIDGLRTDFPNCKITLLGLQVPSRDGFANNYGVSWKYYEKLQFVWDLQQWYMDLAMEYDGIEFVQISGQFDTEYNMSTMNASANLRNSTAVSVGSNGVHPATSGYLQIADAVLRNICTKL